MTEDEARAWVTQRFGQSVTDAMARLVALVVEENSRQNLVAASSLSQAWSRHIVDSLQLLDFAETPAPWIDVGTGGGFPGLPIAVASGAETILVEPRRKRAAFLQECVDALQLRDTRVLACRIEAVTAKAATISARAVASIEKVLQSSLHCANPGTEWILPRGRADPNDLTRTEAQMNVMFHVEQSLTDPASSIVVVRRR